MILRIRASQGYVYRIVFELKSQGVEKTTINDALQGELIDWFDKACLAQTRLG